jgi:hypothetical protein
LVDVCDVTSNAHAYTHYTPTDAARLDRTCVSERIRKHEQGIETLTAAFTDNLAVLVRVKQKYTSHTGVEGGGSNGTVWHV